jgi:NitT/TauT family transport system permease protein
MQVTIYRLLLLVAILGAWEWAVISNPKNAFWVSSPSLIAARTQTWLMDGSLLRHTWVTIYEALSGLAAGTLIGVFFGLMLGVSRTLGRTLEPFIMAINALPRVALAPLLVMYVGIGFASKFLLALSLVVVVLMVNTYEGVKSVDANHVNALRILGASRLQIFVKLLIPNSVPWILAGLRVGVSFAIVGAIVGEFISAQAGIGYMINTASGSYDTTGMMVPLFTLMICAVCLDLLIKALTRRLTVWRPQSA